MLQRNLLQSVEPPVQSPPRTPLILHRNLEQSVKPLVSTPPHYDLLVRRNVNQTVESPALTSQRVWVGPWAFHHMEGSQPPRGPRLLIKSASESVLDLPRGRAKTASIHKSGEIRRPVACAALASQGVFDIDQVCRKHHAEIERKSGVDFDLVPAYIRSFDTDSLDASAEWIQELSCLGGVECRRLQLSRGSVTNQHQNESLAIAISDAGTLRDVPRRQNPSRRLSINSTSRGVSCATKWLVDTYGVRIDLRRLRCSTKSHESVQRRVRGRQDCSFKFKPVLANHQSLATQLGSFQDCRLDASQEAGLERSFDATQAEGCGNDRSLTPDILSEHASCGKCCAEPGAMVKCKPCAAHGGSCLFFRGGSIDTELDSQPDSPFESEPSTDEDSTHSHSSENVRLDDDTSSVRLLTPSHSSENFSEDNLMLRIAQ